jgi:hypothetical protein
MTLTSHPVSARAAATASTVSGGSHSLYRSSASLAGVRTLQV